MTEENVDLMPLVNEQLPILLSQPFDSAIEGMHILERRTRIAKDDNANAEVCTSIVNLCIKASKWSDLANNVSILAKRKGYSRKSVTLIVHLSMDAMESVFDHETKIMLVKCLREVTEGKIFVEVERARLTSILVDHHENLGEMDEAMRLLEELRLEILTTMEEKERVSLMLHQFKLSLSLKDSLRASLCSEKIRDQRLQDNELKLQFLELLIQYNEEFTQDFLEMAQSHYEVYKINNNSESLMQAIICAVLAPHNEKQLRFCNELQGLRDLVLMPEARTLLAVFMGRDLVPYPDFETRFGSIIRQDRQPTMRKRVIEHGLRIASMYYTKIRIERLAELVQLSVEELEERIIDLVFSEQFYARIDRPKGIVTFKKQKKVSEVADEFSQNISKLCRLVDHAHSLIEKERQCIHRVKVN